MSLLAHHERAFAELEQTVKRLDERQLTEIRDPAGWSAKDHLIHVALWEQALLASVDGRPRHHALGIDASTDDSSDWDALNALIFANTKDRKLADVLETLRRTHAETRARLAAAERDGGEPGQKLLADVPGYTEHYEQHRGWIEELVAR